MKQGKRRRKEELPIVSLWFPTKTGELRVRPLFFFVLFFYYDYYNFFFFFSLVFFVFADLYTKDKHYTPPPSPVLLLVSPLLSP